MTSCHSPEALAAELMAIAGRTGPDGTPVYSKTDIREGLPLLLAAACPPDRVVDIPAEIREQLEASGSLDRAGPLTREQLGIVVARHYERCAPKSDFVAQLQKRILEMCDQERRDRASAYRDALGLTPAAHVDYDAPVVRAGPLLRAQLG